MISLRWKRLVDFGCVILIFCAEYKSIVFSVIILLSRTNLAAISCFHTPILKRKQDVCIGLEVRLIKDFNILSKKKKLFLIYICSWIDTPQCHSPRHTFLLLFLSKVKWSYSRQHGLGDWVPNLWFLLGATPFNSSRAQIRLFPQGTGIFSTIFLQNSRTHRTTWKTKCLFLCVRCWVGLRWGRSCVTWVLPIPSDPLTFVFSRNSKLSLSLWLARTCLPLFPSATSICFSLWLIHLIPMSSVIGRVHTLPWVET